MVLPFYVLTAYSQPRCCPSHLLGRFCVPCFSPPLARASGLYHHARSVCHDCIYKSTC